MATINLSKVEARGKLAPRRDPYWQRLEAGAFVGYRKMSAGVAGTWSARCRDEATGKQQHKALGAYDDQPAHLRFDLACKEAREWLAHLGKGGTAAPITVKEACENYVKHLRAGNKESTAHDTEKRFERWVDNDKIANIQLEKLKPGDVDGWRKRMSATPATPQDKTVEGTRARSPSTINRDMTSLRAALNLAIEDGHATTDAPWKAKLKPIKNADGRRDVYLDITQRRALIGKAQPDLAAFLRALSLVPLRPGAMAALVVGNYDGRLSTLTIGKDKNGQDRRITLPKDTAEFFAAQAKDKLPAAPLLARADGSAWNKDSWKYPFKDAVIAAELPPAATAYALRHSTITDLIALHKLDTLTVAQLSGTSLQMIENHYGHLLRDHAAKALSALKI